MSSNTHWRRLSVFPPEFHILTEESWTVNLTNVLLSSFKVCFTWKQPFHVSNGLRLGHVVLPSSSRPLGAHSTTIRASGTLATLSLLPGTDLQPPRISHQIELLCKPVHIPFLGRHFLFTLEATVSFTPSQLATISFKPTLSTLFLERKVMPSSA